MGQRRKSAPTASITASTVTGEVVKQSTLPTMYVVVLDRIG